jgi:hypothetical protein
LNRTGTSSVEGKSPFELWYNKKPKIEHLRIIGCTAYVHVPIQQRRKIDSKAETGILVGYEGDDSYRVFVQPGNKTLRSRDVIFDEKLVTRTNIIDWPVNMNSDDETVGSEDLKSEEMNDTDRDQNPTSEDQEEMATDNVRDVQGMQLRNRQRIRQPARLNDYVMSMVLETPEPENYEQAIHSDQRQQWQNAMDSEM